MADSLYQLLPAILRERDAFDSAGMTLEPLRDLTTVMQEQIDELAAELDLLYDGWFVETCPPWVLPYLAALVGERIPPSPGIDPGEPERALARARLIVPRALVANAIARRRRKGTRPALEDIVRDLAGWPACAVESYRHLAWNQHLNHLRPARGQFVDLRDTGLLARLEGPFDGAAHLVDVRRIDAPAPERAGRWNIPSVPVYAFRMLALPVTRAPARAIDREAGNVFTFSALGNDAPLFTRRDADQPPVRLTRQMLASDPDRYYGDGRSVRVETGIGLDGGAVEYEEIPAGQILVASLRRLDAEDEDGWPNFAWPAGLGDGERVRVIVDPEAGRLMFRASEEAPEHVRVTYHQGFARAMGGGEYLRPVVDPGPDALRYGVGPGERHSTIAAAIAAWQARPDSDRGRPAVIEIGDSGVYTGPVTIVLAPGDIVHLRAAQASRPIIRVLDTEVDKREAVTVGGSGGCFTLDGVIVEGRGMLVRGAVDRVDIRHTTLVPGWGLDQRCHPRAAGKASIVVRSNRTCLSITDSIVGPIHVEHDEVALPAIPINIADSILDANHRESAAIRRVSGGRAHAVIDVRRSTVVGRIAAHAIELGEDALFLGDLDIARRQLGCLRFSVVATDAVGPSRYRCQPDLAIDAHVPFAEDEIWPRFETLRYGLPDYARLHLATSPAVLRGASDAGEMGAYHDLYEPQRRDSASARLAQATPASMDAALILAS